MDMEEFASAVNTVIEFVNEKRPLTATHGAVSFYPQGSRYLVVVHFGPDEYLAAIAFEAIAADALSMESAQPLTLVLAFALVVYAEPRKRFRTGRPSQDGRVGG